MVLEKTLNRIHEQINKLAPTLELFVEESVQPTVQDCESLQRQLVVLQETLAVFTFHLKEKDLSPNFNLHSKVSEINVMMEEKAEQLVETTITEEKSDASVSPEVKILSAISVGMNDKFRIINELFKQNGGEYNVAMEQLNSLNNWNEAEIYLNSLKMIYYWSDNSDVTILFYNLTKKRFM
jgi:hypothetical protein